MWMIWTIEELSLYIDEAFAHPLQAVVEGPADLRVVPCQYPSFTRNLEKLLQLASEAGLLESTSR